MAEKFGELSRKYKHIVEENCELKNKISLLTNQLLEDKQHRGKLSHNIRDLLASFQLEREKFALSMSEKEIKAETLINDNSLLSNQITEVKQLLSQERSKLLAMDEKQDDLTRNQFELKSSLEAKAKEIVSLQNKLSKTNFDMAVLRSQTKARKLHDETIKVYNWVVDNGFGKSLRNVIWPPFYCLDWHMKQQAEAISRQTSSQIDGRAWNMHELCIVEHLMELELSLQEHEVYIATKRAESFSWRISIDLHFLEMQDPDALKHLFAQRLLSYSTRCEDLAKRDDLNFNYLVDEATGYPACLAADAEAMQITHAPPLPRRRPSLFGGPFIVSLPPRR
jgi:hypothetical protein